MSQSDKPKSKPSKTNFLNLPSSAQTAPDRAPTPGTTLLNEAWRLILKVGDKTEKIAVKPKIVFGRKAEESDEIDFDLTPHGAYQTGVSRKHAIISLVDGSLHIEDLGSTNGTRINGAQLTPKRLYRLRDGDEVEFARLRVIIRFEKPDK